ncbi:flagellar assembly protein FliW [Blastococcus sp. TML/M2B]|uniref:flagellar assembly protein FliW n=1 Tax=unclassified Blastococcus TaxID=2619396 RepID=UPI00190D75B4|nr:MULTISPECIES: flagellar assembly protein FliW [unclassified Blastococcus]MBN1091626.1 flagellar assembly protein FliW [Blastococcus sp. TML/M2B]MBN1094816.1 flagellar assembly protein FliW [Blastococcus sp. TML/C7B]
MAPTPAALAARPHAPAAAPALPVPAVQVLTLTEPLLGFPEHRDYVLVPADGTGNLSWLQSVAPDGPRFLVARADAYFPEYAPQLPWAACVELGIGEVSEAQVHCLVTVPAGDVSAATANLRAPLVVSPLTARARQVVLLDPAHPVRRPMRR